MTKKTATLIGTIALAAITAVGAEQSSATNKPAPASTSTNKIAELFPDPAVVKGKGFEIKRSKLDDAVSTLKANLAANGQPIPPNELMKVERTLLERLIQIQLLLSRATDADKAKGKEAADKRFDTLKKSAPSEEMLAKQLKLLGMTQEQLQVRMSEESTSEAVLERELSPAITDDQIKKFYDENPTKFEQPEQVRASHILIGTQDAKAGTEFPDLQKAVKKKLAEDVLKRARAGEDFAKLAKQYSDDPGSKDNGGEYTFARGQMVPEFEAAAFSLKTNQVSDIVTTHYGYHIIKLSEKIPAQKIELSKVSDNIKQFLKGREIQKQLRSYFEKLKKETDTQILDEKLKAIDPYAEADKAAAK